MMDNKDKAIKIAQYNKIIQYRESHPKCRYCKYCDYKKPYGYKHYIYYCKIKWTESLKNICQTGSMMYGKNARAGMRDRRC